MRKAFVLFYSHVNYSVTKMLRAGAVDIPQFYSHVNYSVTKICDSKQTNADSFTVT